MLASFRKILKFSWESFSQNKGLFFTTILVITITTFLIVSLFLLKGLTSSLVSNLQEKVDISVYFNLDAEEGEILKVKEKLSDIPEVKDVEYISREKALAFFIEKHKDNPVIMESLEEIGENPLAAHLNVRAWQASQYEQISNFLEQGYFRDIIDKIDFHQNKTLINRIFSISVTIERTSLILILVLAGLAVLVAFNTVRLGIMNFRSEISIMRLVGASNWFIRGPFVVQGMISGIFATIITISIFSVGCYYLTPKIGVLITGFNLFEYFKSNLGAVIAIQLVSALGLGIIPALFAIRKYLKV